MPGRLRLQATMGRGGRQVGSLEGKRRESRVCLQLANGAPPSSCCPCCCRLVAPSPLSPLLRSSWPCKCVSPLAAAFCNVSVLSYMWCGCVSLCVSGFLGVIVVSSWKGWLGGVGFVFVRSSPSR
ncbi:hypothetical protein M758_12G112000, partial [Ceratodon purpureus]